ncbi:hypothetical protein AB0M43_04685 [Longispora sp. NPDC051575]|uniref:hypothetical protein n=1 Tax=Longispora sp. NPDC051575 TaxID=3154943 RepID=UPI00344805F8
MLNVFKGRAWFAARWTLVAVLLGGCSLASCCCCGWVGPSPDVVAADVVGNWDGPHGGTLTINANGTFTRTDVLECGDNRRTPGSTRINDSGTWTLEGPESFDPEQVLTLETGPPHQNFQIVDDEHLYAFIGDPDDYDMCTYTKAKK